MHGVSCIAEIYPITPVPYVRQFIKTTGTMARYIYAKQNHLGCKKVRGQSEATCKQAGATKSFDISGGQEVSYFIKKLLTP